MRSDSTPMQRYQRLSRLGGYDVARNDPDPRGRTVVNRDGRAVGKVRDLIVETDRMRATYLDVELDAKLFDLRDDDPHVLVPVDRAHVDGRKLVVDDLDSTWVREMHAARDRHYQEFWDGWWHRDQRRDGHPDEIRRVVQDLRPGQSARIPLVQEEIVVERRPVAQGEPLLRDESRPELLDDRRVDARREERGEYAVNRAADEPPSYRR